MKATKLPSGAWTTRVYLGKGDDGKAIYKRITSPDRRECLRRANEIADHAKEIRSMPAKMTLKEGIEEYIRIKENVLSPATIRGYEQIKKYHLQAEMDMKLRDIDNTVAQNAINREAREYSAKTVKNVYGLLSVVMRQFTRADLTVTLPRIKSNAPTMLTTSQMILLIKELQGHKAELAYLMAMFLGLRRSEIIAFDPKRDYNKETRVIHISHAKVLDKDNKFIEKDTTKTETSDRYLEVPQYLAERIEARMAEGIELYNMHPANMARSLHRVCNKIGIPELGLHDLRHQNASVMMSLGTPDKYMMERGGWSTDYVMKRTYQHTISDARKEVDKKVNDYFQSLANQATGMTKSMTRDSCDR